jgi:hypothetical protein
VLHRTWFTRGKEGADNILGVNIYLVDNSNECDVERMRFADSQMQYPHLENHKARAHTRSPGQDDPASVLDD